MTKRGGLTSHVAIIAKSRGIPYVAHLDFDKISADSLIIIDGRKGEVIVDPEPRHSFNLTRLQKKQTDFQKILQSGETFRPLTEDGYSVRLYLNVNHPKEVERSRRNGMGLAFSVPSFSSMSSPESPPKRSSYGFTKSCWRSSLTSRVPSVSLTWEATRFP